MKRSIFLFSIAALPIVAGCSSVSLPELPSISLSMPWSSSAPQPDPNADAVFNRGMELFESKKYVAAIDQFNKIKQEYPFAAQATQAELKIAESYYLNKQYPESVAAFREFQSLHPTNENIPFVVYRLGMAHFDQFTTTDRDQKNTEIAKGYFETVINQYPQSPYAEEAKAKLAKCNEYLAESDFNVAYFYFQQEKYPAARDRFEEIVRRYRGTPTAPKSLFYLGESYRKEKNSVKAALAFEALMQYYPRSKFADEAKIQMAEVEKEKHDPLAMLLMRDRRPTLTRGAEPGATETASNAKLKDVDNLVAKTDVVYEEPGQEKGTFRRVLDKLNPFADDKPKGEIDSKKSDSDATLEALAKKNAADKKGDSSGVFASLWNGINPFTSGDAIGTNTADSAKSGQLVDQIDSSLKNKGIDSKTQTAALQPPAAALPKVEEPAPVPVTDTKQLLGQIDSTLNKGGKPVGELPPPPEAAEIFKDAAAAQALAAKAKAPSEPPQSIASSGLLGSIDQKLKSQGLEPTKFEAPPASAEAKTNTPPKEQVKKVELEPKVVVEKGPLFLGRTEIPAQEKPTASQEETKQPEAPAAAPANNPPTPAVREIPKALVKGPQQPPQPVATVAKPAAQPKQPTPEDDDAPKGVMDQLKEDADTISKILNPFRW